MKRHSTWRGRFLVMPLGTLALLVAVMIATASTALAAPTDWTTYLYSNAHDGFNPTETAINPTTAPNLKLRWTHTAAGGISSQPTVANGLVYWGSWDGYEHATNQNNVTVWAAYLGQTSTSCGGTAFGPVIPTRTASGNLAGVAGASTIATVNGTPTLFVAGGNASFYALNALNGHIIWHTALGTPPAFFIWSSPAVYNGSVYIGVASEGDCPLVRSKLVQLNATSGAIQHVYYTVPSGCIGAGVWGAPTVDEAAGTVYFATGNPGKCGTSEPYAESLIELNASTLAFIHHWQVPASQATGDGDFGSTPTLFTATINGTATNLVGVANKNGVYYAFNRANINAGPVWQRKVASAGACPQCGNGSISPSAWDGSTLYVGGGSTTIGGVSCAGGLRALNPANGALIWEHCMGAGPVLGASTAVPGLVVVGQGSWIIMVNATTGQTVFRFHDTSGSPFYGAATIANGVMYQGNMNGHLYSFVP